MEHFVTLFDSFFLPQGIALYRSLERNAGDFCLWILCLDEEAHSTLSKLQLRAARLISLSAVETDALRKVRPGRTRAEYCWTLTPFAPRFVFEADSSVARVTYVDADIWFLRDPAPIFRELELSGKSVLITKHAYSPEHDQSSARGEYCVQFLTFVKETGEQVRHWWEERCLEWCYSREEDGKFGDQKYLERMRELFPDLVHVLNRESLTLAPWNATRFPYGDGVLYHFHGLRIKSKTRIVVANNHYFLPLNLIDNVYRPYARELQLGIQELSRIGFEARAQFKWLSEAGLRILAQFLVRPFKRAIALAKLEIWT